MCYIQCVREKKRITLNILSRCQYIVCARTMRFTKGYFRTFRFADLDTIVFSILQVYRLGLRLEEIDEEIADQLRRRKLSELEEEDGGVSTVNRDHGGYEQDLLVIRPKDLRLLAFSIHH